MVLAFYRRGSVIHICLYLLVGRYMKERISGLRNESLKIKRIELFQRMTVTTSFIQKERVDYFPTKSLCILVHKLGIEEIMADYVHQEMTLKWILVYLILFLFIVIKDVFLFGSSFSLLRTNKIEEPNR